MRRRSFIIGGSTFATCVTGSSSRAQPSNAVRRVAFLIPVSVDTFDALFSAMRSEIAERGLVENRNIVFDAVYADGEPARLPLLAQELIRRRPDVIVAQSTPAVQAAAALTETIPIVAISVVDPVAIGLTISLARPSRNVTGYLNFFDALAAKRLGYLLQLNPLTRRVGFLYGDASSLLAHEAMKPVAQALGIETVLLAVTERAGAVRALTTPAALSIDALIVNADPVTYPATAEIVEFTITRRLPAIYSLRQMAVDGGLLALSFDAFEGVRMAADYVARILNGARLDTLPFQQPSQVILTVNLRTARRSGIELPPALIALADELID